jgi:hypothetical protein
MSDALDRRDRLAEYSGERSSIVLISERWQAIGPLQCEIFNKRHPGGIARGVVLDEPGAGTWVLWMSFDGWSLAEHSDGAVCPQHQSDPLLRTLRFAE